MGWKKGIGLCPKCRERGKYTALGYKGRTARCPDKDCKMEEANRFWRWYVKIAFPRRSS